MCDVQPPPDRCKHRSSQQNEGQSKSVNLRYMRMHEVSVLAFLFGGGQKCVAARSDCNINT